MIVSERHINNYLSGLSAVGYLTLAQWQALPDGEEKYLEAKKIMAAYRAELVAAGIDGIPSYAISNANVSASQYVTGMQQAGRQLFMGRPEIAQKIVDLYNARQPVGAVMSDVFAHFNSYFKQGQAAPGNFTIPLAQSAIRQWAVDSSPSKFDKAMEVVIPVFLVAVSVLAIAGAAGAGAGAGGTASGGAAATTTAPTIAANALPGVLGITAEQAASAALFAYQLSEKEKEKQHAKEEQQKQEALAVAAQQQQAQAAAVAQQTKQSAQNLWGLALAAVAALAAFM